MYCENLTTRHYKYLHKVRSALLASASNKNQKHKETSTNVTATLFTTNTEDMYADVTYCYSGSSAQLLVFLRDESCKTCISNSSHQLQSSKIILKTSRENPTSKTLTCLLKSCSNLQVMQGSTEIHHKVPNTMKYAETSKACRKYVIHAHH